MALSKKHYEQFAQVLADVAANGDIRLPSTLVNEDTRRDTVKTIANTLAIHFKLDNNAFDTKRFLKARGF